MTWYKGDEVLKPKRLDRRIRTDWDIDTDLQSLVIENATEADAGKYSVHVENPKGCLIITVDVIVADDIDELLVETRHQRKTLDASDKPLRWLAESGDTPEELVSPQKELAKGEVDEGDMSIKEIIARELDEARGAGRKPKESKDVLPSSKEVSVRGAPQLVVPPEPTSVDVGGTIRLTCKVTGILRGTSDNPS